MSKPNPGDVLFWSLAAVAATAFVFFALVLVGAVPIGSSEPAVEAAAAVAAPVEAEPEPSVEEPVADAPRPEPDIERGSSTASAAKPPAARLVNVVVTATRGDCWLSARAGGENGRLLEERVLLQGESVRLRAARVWLSLGASSNVDVLVDGQPREISAGTVARVLAPRSTP